MRNSRFGVVAGFAFAVAITALLLHLWQSQLVAPSGATRTAFSEEHAFATLSALLKEQRPHTAGSPENAVVRDRILAELKSAGYAPEVQAAFQCDTAPRNPGCTAVENIVAVHKGTGDGKAVLASAHYDSVPAGPGVSDDGAGVAVVLELARVFAARTTRNDVIFLLSDGEETGLRGARAFADHHPLMRRVGVVVNFDARGASGPSMMFETGPGNARLMDLFAHAVARPSASSVNYEIYKLLPNDTDFSVYRKLGLSGFNFGFINSAAVYHSVRDNLQSIDRRSLQHTGEHAFEVTGALADADLAALSASSDASFFDIFGLVTVVWPAAINVPIALVALLGLHRTDRRASRRVHGAYDGLGRGCFRRGARAAVCLRMAAVVSAGHLARRASARSSAAVGRPASRSRLPEYSFRCSLPQSPARASMHAHCCW